MTNALVLILPGLGDSGPEHRQSLWEASDLAFRRVVQRDWDNPTLAEWVETLHRYLDGYGAVPYSRIASLARLLRTGSRASAMGSRLPSWCLHRT
jgi:hypothetical protein